MKSFLAGFLFLTSFSVLADPIIDCDEWALAAVRHHHSVVSANEVIAVSHHEDKSIYYIPVETDVEKKLAAITAKADCRYYGIEFLPVE